MKNFIIFVLLLVVAGLGYMLMTKKCEVPPLQNNTDVLSASFSCKNGTSFIAEFSNESNVKIIGKNSTQIVPRVSGEGKRYEDEGLIYTFAGEGAVVMTKSDRSTTTCEQPFDKNNAPVNFGDAGEGAGTKQDIGLAVSENIVGKWQDTEDTTFSYLFNADGTVSDMRSGKIGFSGTWKVFTKEKPLAVNFPLEPGIPYVKIVFPENQDGDINFRIDRLTPEALDLTNADIDRGGKSHFVSIK